MIEKVILPGDRQEEASPLIPFIGPRFDRFGWQYTVRDLLQKIAPEAVLALSQSTNPSHHPHPTESLRQEWERYFLQEGARNGVPAFWVPKYADLCSQRYWDGKTSTVKIRHENTKTLLQQWYMHHRIDGQIFVLGIEPGQPEHDALRDRFATHCPNIPLCDSLEQMCYAVTHIIQ